MNILIDGFFYQLARSGIARVWNDLIDEWTAMSPDINFYFMDRGQDDLLVNCKMLKTPPVPIEKSFELWNLSPINEDRVLINSLCKKHNIDIFMSTYYTFSDVAENILYIHDCIPETFPHLINLEEPIWRMKSDAIYHSKGYICVSENSKNDLYKYYTVAGRPSIVALNGVSKSFKEIDRLAILPSTVDKPFVLIPGLSNKGSYKNHELIFKAIAPLVKSGEIMCVCTGGSAQEIIHEYSEYLEPSEVVTGFYSEQELVALYRDALAVAYTSKYEGFGLPIIESFSQHTPVVTCNNSSLFEVGAELAVYVGEDDYLALQKEIKLLIQKPTSKLFEVLCDAELTRFNWQNSVSKIDTFVRQMALEKMHVTWMEENGFS